MKLMYLNIFEGCKDPARLEKVVRYVNREKPDVLGMSELRDWQRNDFEKTKFFCKETNFPSYFFSASEVNYNLALFSRLPVSSSMAVSKGFRSALSQIQLLSGSIKIILVHLTAKNEDDRLNEIARILELIGKPERTILMGDMNALSPHDDYDKAVLLAEIKNRGLEKFGKERIRTEVIQKILDFGFVDAVKKFSSEFEYSVPTDFNRDEAHFSQLRLDYIFVSQDLEPSLKSARIMRTKETSQLSDHFPVAAEIKLKF